METPTSQGNRLWLYHKSQAVYRYIRRNHSEIVDHKTIEKLFWKYPDEARKLVESYMLSNRAKIMMFLDWIIKNPVIFCGIFGDQRQGKDALLCYFFELVQKAIDIGLLKQIRFVTLGNIKAPPFVKTEDMYFSFLNIPVGSKDKEVWIYASELETVIPARDTMKSENRLYDQLSGTMAQNHQKLFGCVKLAYKVDINFFRSCNTKLFKYISEDKLNVENVERDGVLSGLGRLLIPKDRDSKNESLLVFDNYLLNVKTPLPTFWSNEYSEQYRDIPMDRVWEYVDVQFNAGMTVPDIEVALKQKFRKSVKKEEIAKKLGVKTRQKTEGVY